MPQPRNGRVQPGTSVVVDGEQYKAVTADAQKLVKRDYASNVLANLGQTRHFNEHFIYKSVGEFDPRNVTLEDLWLMREDYMIKMGLHYSKAPIIRADYDIQCEDPRIRAAALANWADIHQPLTRTALNSLDFGFQGAIKQWRLGKIDASYENPDSGDVEPVWNDDILPLRMEAPIPLPPGSTHVKLKNGRFDGILTPFNNEGQLIPGGATSIGNSEERAKVPAEWAMWYVNEFEEQLRNWYGMSRIKPAYRHWYSYWYHFHMRDRHAEMDADPALQVWYPPGSFVPDPNDIDPQTQRPRVMQNRDAALQIGEQLRGGATIAWPSDVFVDEQGKAAPIYLWKAEFLTGGENLAAFNDLLADLEIGKLRATLVPEQALVEAKRGTSSRNAAASYEDIHTQSLEMTAQYLDHLHTQYVLRPWVEANFGKDAPPCKKVTTGFQEEDMTLAGALVQAAFTADPNALPINWEQILDQLNVPMYSKKEQEEREQAAAEMQAEQQAQLAEQQQEALANGGDPNALPGEGGPGAAVAALPGERTPAQLAASIGPKPYEREVIHLSTKAKRVAPAWAQREGKRRDRNVAAITERMRDLVQQRYETVFQACADALASEPIHMAGGDLALGISDTIGDIVDRIRRFVQQRTAPFTMQVTGEMASMYHATGLAELNRLGLSAESWDIGRVEVQDWAKDRAGELIVTIDKTVVENHVRPWLTETLGDPEFEAHFIERGSGIPVSLELASQLTDRFSAYPQWMAERVVRTEAMRGYNLSAADMWERVGVTEVDLFDGLGGKSGVSDEECLARNGQRVSIQEFRELTLKEHPNGTLGATPVAATMQAVPLGAGTLTEGALMSSSIYGVTDGGLLLSQEEVGRALAEG